MKKLAVSAVVGLFLVFGQISQANVVISEKPLSVKNNGIAGLLGKVKRSVAIKILTNIDKDTSDFDKYMECSEVSEIKGAFVCVAFYQSDLNDAFTRMGIFMGAGKGLKQGTLLKESNWKLKNYKKLVAGHNLPGYIVNDFYKQAKQDTSIKLNSMEQQFYNTFVENSSIKQKKDNTYIIGLSVQSTKSQESVATHEIFHAQYLLTPNYKRTVDKFWHSQVSEEDKKKIKQTLGKAYSTEDFIIIDEFQAYLIQDNAEKDLLKDFIESYQTKLINSLKKAGIDIIRVKSK